jgi:hypothetical protein
VCDETIGPKPPFASWPSAAVQLHQTDHSSILQHFRRVEVGRADKATMARFAANIANLARSGFSPPM